MRWRRHGWIVAAVAAACALGLPAPARAQTPPAGLSGVHVAGDRFVDAANRTVVLRGINAVGKEGSHGTGTPNLTDADATRIASMGFDMVRLGMTWDAVEPTRGSFDDAFLTRFIAQLDLLHAHGLAAVVDMHQDTWSAYIGSDGAPRWAGPQCHVPPHLDLAGTTGQWVAQYGSPDNQAAWQNFWADGFGRLDPFCTGAVQTEFDRMWAHVAKRLAGNPAVLGYDILNEPFPASAPGVFDATQFNTFYQRAAKAIRSSDRRAIIFFEPPIGALPAPGLRAPDPNSAFAPHVYTETMFSGGAYTTGAQSDRREIEFDRTEASQMGVALWIGEWGAFENAASAPYQHQMYGVFDANQGSDAYWAYTQGGNDDMKALSPAADVGHVRVYPTAFPGSATWTYEPSARTFAMRMTVGPGVHRAVIAAPGQLHLATHTAGAVYDQASQRITWTVHGPGTFAMQMAPA